MHSRILRRPPYLASAFVILALVVLAVTPALVLERLAVAGRELATTLVSGHDRLRQVTRAMEQQSTAMRGFLLAGDPRYRAQLDAARAAETEAIRNLEPLVRSIGPAPIEQWVALQRLSALRHAHDAALMETEADVEALLVALPEHETLRESMLLHLAGIEQAAVRVTAERAAEEARWAARRRSISLWLGVLAVIAAVMVGWFESRQRRLSRRLEQALGESNRLRAESERRRTELERITESRARLMRGFSHDVKNPLGAAHGYLELLAEGIAGPLSEKQAHSVQRASKSITAALHLVEDLLELARAESGKLEVALVPTDMPAVVEDAVDEYRAQAEAKGLSLSFHAPDPVPAVVTDGTRVRQVLGNLVSNAVKYTENGRVFVRLAVFDDGAAATPAPRLAVQVADTGPGIPVEQRHLLFEEFVRLNPTNGRGAGIGLTISNRIAEALGGEITVESVVGAGSTFTLWLPLPKARADVSEDTPPNPRAEA